ncbi:MAG: isoprenyl transferase [Pseudomonadota bacterium]
MSNSADIPTHVAVIMDGNGRWARRRGMPRQMGHRSGVKAVRQTVEHAAKAGVDYLTLFAFSSENWNRPDEEVSSLMALFVDALRREVDELHLNKVSIRFVGALERLSPKLLNMIRAAEEKTADNDGLGLQVAVGYGGRWDILQATRGIASDVAAGELDKDAIDENVFAERLALAGLPDPDLLIRTGGEQRISNFLLWNLAYAELWFTDSLWPDFDAIEFDRALDYFAGRERRYGHTGEQVEAVS